MLIDEGVDSGDRQCVLVMVDMLPTGQTGEQEYGALFGNQWIIDRAVRQPGDQALLACVQAHGIRSIDQTQAGFGVVAQALTNPALRREIEHQAVTAGDTGTGMVSGGRNYRETLLADAAAAPGNLELQQPFQAEYQLRMFVAMGDEVVIVAQR